MKIMINYDLIDRIKDVKQKPGLFKLIRTEKKYILGYTPFYILFNLTITQSVEKSLYYTFGINLPILLMLRAFAHFDNEIERKAEIDLINLAAQLQDLSLETNYELLLESEVYSKKYSISKNEGKIPDIMERKYIYVPSYNNNGDIEPTSIVQEHIIGDKNYVLTLGSPEKKLKLSYSGI